MYYAVALMYGEEPYAIEDNIVSIEPILYCGGERVPDPTKEDFEVNLKTEQKQLNPVMETGDSYFYLLNTEVNVTSKKKVNRLPMLERTEAPEGSVTYQFIQDISYLKDKEGNIPEITEISLGGTVSDDTIIWEYNLSGNDVSFNYYDSEGIFNTTFVYLYNYNYVLGYDANDGKPLIKQYTPIGTPVCPVVEDLEIPSIINEIKVEKIGSNSFRGRNELKSIKIPDSITSIEIYGFANCNNLESVIISDNVTYIGPYAFYVDKNLKSVNIPKKVIKIDNGAFYHCDSIEEIIIPNTLKTIGEGAFEYCIKLKSIFIPNNVESIGIIAFAYCVDLSVDPKTGIKEINMPYKLCENNNKIFQQCSETTTLIIRATSTEIDPTQTPQELLQIWTTRAKNLDLNLNANTKLVNKYLIIDGTEIDLS